MEENKKTSLEELFLSAIIFAVTVAFASLGGYFSYFEGTELIRTVCVGAIMGFCMIFTLEFVRMKDLFMPGMRGAQRFMTIIYVVMMLLGVIGARLSPLIIPLGALVLMILFLSSPIVAMAALFSAASVMLCVGRLHAGYVFDLIIPVFAMLILFSKESSSPSRVSLSHQLKKLLLVAIARGVCTIVFVIAAGGAGKRTVIAALIGIILDLVLSAVFLRVLTYYRFQSVTGRYEQINDPEFELLLELKQANHDEYMIAVHSAMLCMKVAKEMGARVQLCKCLGYYHRIGVLENDAKGMSPVIAEEYRFPAAAVELIDEYCMAGELPVKNTETIICIMANDIVASIRYLVGKNQAMPDTEKVIDLVLQKRYDAGIFDGCNMTVGNYRKLKECFKKEKLYYDFLR